MMKKPRSASSRKVSGNQPGPGKSNEGLRLNRFIAMTGVCSRREADELIRAGEINVNGKTVTEMGIRVGRKDVVTYKGQRLSGERKVYVLLNKPKDCVTTVRDPQGRQTVMDLVKNCCRERIYPVGRLDRNTTGLLLLTNDGALAERLMHPSFRQKKVYQIGLDRRLTKEDLARIRTGIELEDGPIQPDSIAWIDKTDHKQVGMEIHSGRNRIVRRIFEHLGYRVVRLDRVMYAGLTKKGLPRGRWRHLEEKEVRVLLRMTGAAKQTRKSPDRR